MARKKIVFVIVEGPSDDSALGLLLNKIYDKSTVFVHIVRGDITTQPGVTASNVKAKIGDMVKQYAKSNHLKNTHFQQIVHILDMDGAYVPDNAVIEDQKAEKPQYLLTHITTNNPVGLRARNLSKRECLERISSTREIWNIPYQAYYMSCNLDHVLYDKLNLSDEEKERNAMAFARKYRNDIDGFVSLMTESPFAVVNGYLESWAYIKTELRSLERNTNFGICLMEAKKE